MEAVRTSAAGQHDLGWALPVRGASPGLAAGGGCQGQPCRAGLGPGAYVHAAPEVHDANALLKTQQSSGVYDDIWLWNRWRTPGTGLQGKDLPRAPSQGRGPPGVVLPMAAAQTSSGGEAATGGDVPLEEATGAMSAQCMLVYDVLRLHLRGGRRAVVQMALGARSLCASCCVALLPA